MGAANPGAKAFVSVDGYFPQVHDTTGLDRKMKVSTNRTRFVFLVATPPSATV